jgi:hypothetical protein
VYVGTYESITYPQIGFSLKEGYLKLSKIGNVRIIQHRKIEGEVKTLPSSGSLQVSGLQSSAEVEDDPKA